MLFANLKSRGFELETTHVTDPEKLKKLMAVLAIAVLWSLRVGEWKYGAQEDLPLSESLSSCQKFVQARSGSH